MINDNESYLANWWNFPLKRSIPKFHFYVTVDIFGLGLSFRRKKLTFAPHQLLNYFDELASI